MVTFCMSCGSSLPLADLVIRDGSEQTAPDYECPACHQPGGPERPLPEEGGIPDDENDILIVDGSEAPVPVETGEAIALGESPPPESAPTEPAASESPADAPAAPALDDDLSLVEPAAEAPASSNDIEPLPSPFDE